MAVVLRLTGPAEGVHAAREVGAVREIVPEDRTLRQGEKKGKEPGHDQSTSLSTSTLTGLKGAQVCLIKHIQY